MLNIPELYLVNRKIALRTILSGDLKPAEKKRLKSCLKGVTLTHQIKGESIPSFVDEAYRYEVILFLDVTLSDIKKAESMAPVFQKLFKPPCVIFFHDDNRACLSFADKRINPQNDQDIVILETVVTPPQSLENFNNLETLMGKVMDFNAIMNTSHKRGFYLEVMTKAFIAGHSALYSKILDFIDTPIWYYLHEVVLLLKCLDELRRLNEKKKKVVEIKDKVALNQQTRVIMDKLQSKLDMYAKAL